MAEENEEQEGAEGGAEEESESGGGKMVLLIGLVNTLGLIGLAAYIMMGGGGGGGGQPMMSPEQMGEGSLVAASPAGVPENQGAPGPKVEIGELVVNLKEPTGDRYLKTKVELELDSEETRAEVEGRLSAIRYQLNLLLSGQRVADVQGPEAIETLRKSMIRRANAVLAKGRIVNVWPAEWIVQ
jgi:flagellar protein FliL